MLQAITEVSIGMAVTGKKEREREREREAHIDAMDIVTMILMVCTLPELRYNKGTIAAIQWRRNRSGHSKRSILRHTEKRTELLEKRLIIKIIIAC